MSGCLSGEFSVKNVNALVIKYRPLITKLSYELYSKYNQVIDYNDAKQEVLVCLYKCLLRYDPKKACFITYFKTAVSRLKSQLYFEYFHQLKLLQGSIDDPEMRILESIPTRDKDADAEWKFNSFMLSKLSKDAKKIYRVVYLSTGKISPWLISKKLRKTRYNSKILFDQFKSEVSNVLC